MKILVTGANGMLGQDLCPILEKNGYSVIRTDINNLDITNLEMVDSVLAKVKPDIVIHCAAYTNVDKAEEDFDTALNINGFGTENIAKICGKNEITLLYISTDYVFKGVNSVPLKPSDEVSPLNNYGLTKWEGEKAVQKYCKKYYICRTSWLYGIHGKNFVETMLSFADKPELKVVNDQAGCPTWTIELAKAIIKVINRMPYGIYHTCGGGYTTWYGFAKKIFELAGVNANLKPCKTEEFPRPAKRPVYSVMDNGGLCRNWEDAIKDYINLYHSQ